MCLTLFVAYCHVSSCTVCYSENVFHSFSFWLISYNPFWETSSISPSQETSNIVWKPVVHYHVHKTTPVDPNPRQTNRLNTHFIIIPALRLGLPSGILPPVYQTHLSLQRENVLEVYRVKASNSWTEPEGSRKVRFPEHLDSRHMEVVTLSALRTGLLYSPQDTPGTHFC